MAGSFGANMRVKPIKSDIDYRRALREIDRLMDAQANSPKGDRLDAMATLVEAWEEKHYPIETPPHSSNSCRRK